MAVPDMDIQNQGELLTNHRSRQSGQLKKESQCLPVGKFLDYRRSGWEKIFIIIQ